MKSQTYTHMRGTRDSDGGARRPSGGAQGAVVDYPVGGPVGPFVSRKTASIMGVSVKSVDRWVREGMPSVTWGRRTRRFRPSVAIDWVHERMAE